MKRNFGPAMKNFRVSISSPPSISPVWCKSLPKKLSISLALLLFYVLAPLTSLGADLTSVFVTNNGSNPETVFTFGQVFKPGDVPAGNTLGGKLPGGTAVPLQVDKKVTHPDGSLRHAVLTARVGALGPGQSQTVILYPQSGGSSGVPVSLTDLLATSFNAVATLNVGGTTYTASARTFLQAQTPLAWLAGPEVSEWIVGGSVKDGSGNSHPHLAAYFHVRAYAGSPITRVRVDTVIENGWTFKSGPTSYTMNATVQVGGNTIFSNPSLTQYNHTRWHVVGWWGGTQNVYVKPDTQYLRNTYAVPNYDNTITIQSSVLSSYTQTITPMGIANLRQSWGDTGYSPQIGISPEWDASFIISGDERAYKGVLANASAGGSFSYHYRLETTGGLPTIDTYTTLTEQNSCGAGTDRFPCTSGGNPNVHENAHPPDIGTLAYLLTGDYYYLEEAQFIANWFLINMNDGYRSYGSGIANYEHLQTRAVAWILRGVANAAYISQDNLLTGGKNLKTYFTNIVNNNMNSYYTNFAAGPANVLGVFQDYAWSSNYFAAWQADFVVAAMNRVVELGFTSTNAYAVRNWFNRWPAGRLGSTGSDWCYIYGTAYNLYPGGATNPSGVYYTNFRSDYLAYMAANQPAVNVNNCPAGQLMHIGTYPTENSGYYSNMQPAVAMARDAGQVTAAQWTLFKNAGTPNYSLGPVWAVVPRAGGTVPLKKPSSPRGLAVH